jgi:flavin-binding protein dodecin
MVISMSVAKVSEIIASSKKSFDDALNVVLSAPTKP